MIRFINYFEVESVESGTNWRLLDGQNDHHSIKECSQVSEKSLPQTF